MTRRRRVVLLLAGLVLASGCTGTANLGPAPETAPEPHVEDGTATRSPRPNASDPVPLPLPEPPGRLTAERAGEYAAAYEETRMHNELLSDVEATVTEVGTSCSVAAVDPDEDAYRATVECSHWYEFESGSAVGVADGAPYRTTYLVDEDGVEVTADRRPVF